MPAARTRGLPCLLCGRMQYSIVWLNGPRSFCMYRAADRSSLTALQSPERLPGRTWYLVCLCWSCQYACRCCLPVFVDPEGPKFDWSPGRQDTSFRAPKKHPKFRHSCVCAFARLLTARQDLTIAELLADVMLNCYSS